MWPSRPTKTENIDIRGTLLISEENVGTCRKLIEDSKISCLGDVRTGKEFTFSLDVCVEYWNNINIQLKAMSDLVKMCGKRASVRNKDGGAIIIQEIFETIKSLPECEAINENR